VTLFEYLAAAYVLMLSFGLVRAMSGVPHAVRPATRYWLHTAWLASALFTCLVCFWAFWPYRDVEWTILRFMNTLAVPALLYSFIALLVPADPSIVTSWRDHFFEVRSRLFATGATMMAAVIVSNQFTLGVPPLHPSQLGNYGLLAIYCVGFSSAKPAVHVVLVIAILLLATASLLTLMMEPDSLFRTVQ
jgi:hypothetical protein